MIRRPPRSTPLYSSAASDVYKRQTRRTLPGLDMYVVGIRKVTDPSGSVHRWSMAVVSSCREMLGYVPQRAQPLLSCCQHLVGDSWRTAGDKPEEGGDDVKSSCPLCSGLHTCYNGRHNGLQYREVERIPQSRSQFGLESETRLHEGGIASNRESATSR